MGDADSIVGAILLVRQIRGEGDVAEAPCEEVEEMTGRQDAPSTMNGVERRLIAKVKGGVRV